MQLDPDEIRHNPDDFFDKEASGAALTPGSIFVAVLAAIIVSWFLKAAYDEWQIRRALALFNQQISSVNKQTQKSIERMQLRTRQTVIANNRVQQARLEQVKREKLAKRQVEINKQAAITEKRQVIAAKALAWEDYYKPIKGCESSNDNKDLMKCGNDYARSKKRFEKLWVSKNSSLH